MWIVDDAAAVVVVVVVRLINVVDVAVAGINASHRITSHQLRIILSLIYFCVQYSALWFSFLSGHYSLYTNLTTTP